MNLLLGLLQHFNDEINKDSLEFKDLFTAISLRWTFKSKTQHKLNDLTIDLRISTEAQKISLDV